MAWVSNYWDYDSTIGLHRDNTTSVRDLYYRNSYYDFNPNKSYLYKTEIYNIDAITSGDLLTIKTDWDDIFTPFPSGSTNGYTDNTGYIYFNSSPDNTTNSRDWLIYSATSSFDTKGIKNVDVYELDWKINGLSWINTGETASSFLANSYSDIIDNYCPGWSFNDVESRFTFLSLTATSSRSLYPIGGINNLQNPAYDKINYIYRYVEYQTFNLKFNFLKYERTVSSVVKSDLTKGVSIYLSTVEPYMGTFTYSWDNFLTQNCTLVGNFTQSSANLFLGLEGNQYILFVGDESELEDGDNTFDIYGIEIEGGYHEQNNEIFQMSLPDLSVNIPGATFTSLSGTGRLIEGVGSTILNDLVGSQVSSKIGNGSFLSGKWENGVWNNGWRLDEDVREFYDLDLSVKTLSDIRWRFRLVGPSSSVSDLNVGDEISIGNIIGIDINEKRKILKGSYKILSKSLNGRLGYIIVELETKFPLRRIEKDSSNHRIYVTRNIWLSGAFLNGYYTGVWNYGLFKGYPLITEMYDTQWIDGIYDGGHYSTNYYINGTFEETFYADGNKLGLSFSQPHNLTVGDIIEIDKSDKSINPRYDGEYSVTSVINDYQLTTDADWGTPVNGETGSVTTTYTTGVIQNMKFYSNNISKITSVDSLNSSSVFTYNSWIDVVYQEDSAVNVGRPQTLLNEVSRKYFSQNNLYGYPTNDVLSSLSKFRDSYSLTERNYNLGVKYKLYNDFVGESSKFTDYFGESAEDTKLFLDKGWTFSVESSSVATFSRTSNVNLTNIQGEELKVNTNKKGAFLDLAEPADRIFNRTLEKIEKERYTVVEFDIVDFNTDYTDYIPIVTQTISWSFFGNTYSFTYAYPDLNKPEPVINFDNINKEYREDLNRTIELTYLPVYKNINHLLTKKKRKVEYFYNKRNLSMNFRGSGVDGISESEFIINNLKIIEVDMIPFFKYFNYENINIGIQIPYQGIAPYIDYSNSNFNFIDNINIGLESINIQSSLDLFSGIGLGITNVVIGSAVSNGGFSTPNSSITITNPDIDTSFSGGTTLLYIDDSGSNTSSSGESTNTFG